MVYEWFKLKVYKTLNFYREEVTLMYIYLNLILRGYMDNFHMIYISRFRRKNCVERNENLVVQIQMFNRYILYKT